MSERTVMKHVRGDHRAYEGGTLRALRRSARWTFFRSRLMMVKEKVHNWPEQTIFSPPLRGNFRVVPVQDPLETRRSSYIVTVNSTRSTLSRTLREMSRSSAKRVLILQLSVVGHHNMRGRTPELLRDKGSPVLRGALVSTSQTLVPYFFSSSNPRGTRRKSMAGAAVPVKHPPPEEPGLAGSSASQGL